MTLSAQKRGGIQVNLLI